VFGQVNWTGRDRCLGSRSAWYLTHDYGGRDQTCDLQKLQVAPLAVPLFQNRGAGAKLAIDSLLDLQMAAVDDTRFREFMYSLAQRFSRHGISLLTTYETPDLFTSGLSTPAFIAALARDAVRLGGGPLAPTRCPGAGSGRRAVVRL